MPKRGSRRLAKKASIKSGRKRSRPNVFVSDAPAEPREAPDAPRAATPPEPAATEAAPEAVAAPARAGRPARPSTQARTVRGQQVRARSEVFTQYLPQELRKIGILSVGMLTALILLTVFLR